MLTLPKRRPSPRRNSEKLGALSSASPEFAPDSLEAELSVIGKLTPARAWAKLPVDYFANLDHYRHGAPKRK